MSRVPRVLSILMIVGGGIMIAAGSTTYYLVHRELRDEQIVVADDAANFAGKNVGGPLTAYSEAAIIKVHASEIADGLTYAQLGRDDPRRDSVMTASFLRASLFTSVVAFGLSGLVVGLGILFILAAVAIMSLDKRTRMALAPALSDDAAAMAPPPVEVVPPVVTQAEPTQDSSTPSTI